MTRGLKITPSLIALAIGFGALVWGLTTLYIAIDAERQDALAAIATRQRAVDGYTTATMAELMRSRLDAVSSDIDRAIVDPLVPAERFYFAQGERRILPRPVTYQPGDDRPAFDRYQSLVSSTYSRGDEDDTDPFNAQLDLYHHLILQINDDDTAAIEKSVLALLSHRLRFRIAVTKQIPLTLAFLTRLIDGTDVDRRFVAGTLRDGVPAQTGERIEGVMITLLLHRYRFTQPDFTALATLIAQFADRFGVPADDFLTAVAATDQHAPDPSIMTNGDMLFTDEGFYLKRESYGVIRGVRLDRAELVKTVRADLVTHHLVDPAATVSFIPSVDPDYDAVGAMHVDSPTWNAQVDTVHRRHLIKTGLIAACALFGFIIVSFSATANERKERFLTLQSDFVASVSHELRTPLASVRLMAETVEKRLSDDGKNDNYLHRIVAEVDRLHFLVENILSFNRLSKGGWTLHPAPIRLDEIVVWITESAPLFTDRPVAIQHATADGVSFSADPELIKLLFLNLATNAARYNSNDSVVIHMAVEQGAKTIILFSDNGIGIPEPEQEKVFDEFYRPDRSYQSVLQGSGLGLAICRRIMALHGGSITVVRSSVEGTIFQLVF